MAFALAARMNVLAMIKRLLGLPSSEQLRSRRRILASTVDFEAKNDRGFTAVDIAAYAGKNAVIDALLKWKKKEKNGSKNALVPLRPAGAAPVDDDPLEDSIMKCAVCGGKEEVILLLMSHYKPNRATMLHGVGLWSVSGVTDTAQVDTEIQNDSRQFPLAVTFKDVNAFRSFLFCPPGKKAYFEVELVRAGDGLSLGFVAERWGGATLNGGGGGGGTAFRGVVGRGWKDGDVIGVACDLEQGRMHFSVNGKFDGRMGADFNTPIGELMYPAFTSPAAEVVVRFNFGGPKFMFQGPDPSFRSVLVLSGQLLMEG